MQRKKSLTRRISFRPHHLFFLFLLLLAAVFTLESSVRTRAAGTAQPVQGDPSVVGAWGPVTTLNSITSAPSSLSTRTCCRTGKCCSSRANRTPLATIMSTAFRAATSGTQPQVPSPARRSTAQPICSGVATPSSTTAACSCRVATSEPTEGASPMRTSTIGTPAPGPVPPRWDAAWSNWRQP